MSASDDLDVIIIVGVAALVLYGLYKAGQLLNEGSAVIQGVESYL